MLSRAYDILKEHDLRMTSQRKAILEILYNCRGHHLEAENIYDILAVKKKGIGMATVYRALELFEKMGLVSRLSMENLPARYELIVYDKMHHHHLICLRCGQVQEIDDRFTESFKQCTLEEKGFQVAEKPMKIYGYCNKCK